MFGFDATQVAIASFALALIALVVAAGQHLRHLHPAVRRRETARLRKEALALVVAAAIATVEEHARWQVKVNGEKHKPTAQDKRHLAVTLALADGRGAPWAFTGAEVASEILAQLGAARRVRALPPA